MDLEELELRFTANYGDVMRKLDEFTNIISQKLMICNIRFKMA